MKNQNLGVLLLVPLLLENLIYHFVIGGKPQPTLFFWLGSDLKALLFPVLLSWTLLATQTAALPTFQKRFTILNLTCFFLFVASSLIRSKFDGGQALVVVRAMLAATTIVSAVFVFVSPVGLLSLLRRIPRSVARAALGLTLLFVLGGLAQPLWRVLLFPVGHSVVALIKIAQVPVLSTFAQQALMLQHPKFHVSIYYPCSGLDGIKLLSVALLIPLVLDAKRFQKGLGTYIGSGLLLIFCLNVIRISAIYIAGAITAGRSGGELALIQVIDSFHGNSGAVLYTLGIGCFFFFLYRRQNSQASLN